MIGIQNEKACTKMVQAGYTTVYCFKNTPPQSIDFDNWGFNSFERNLILKNLSSQEGTKTPRKTNSLSAQKFHAKILSIYVDETSPVFNRPIASKAHTHSSILPANSFHPVQLYCIDITFPTTTLSQLKPFTPPIQLPW
eukprot:TRINITY_DN6306_c0_g3_i3.p1 TRINITY_DN6306_c0_g3~~TRINITY_DN6306_c0_g3_i3.p1  ORF type:complete len:139 (+),score=15.48 TRINITY_DN6306_c0_g3_i3:147-563(+)